MPLKIIGAGFGRTGTMSVKRAVEQLGCGPCYHMHEVFLHPEHIELWNRAGRGELRDWEEIFADFPVTVDWPAAAFWRELAAAYPQARVLLTVRDADAWYRSASSTIFRMMDPARATTEIGRAQLEMAQTLLAERAFGGRLDDRDHCIDVYRRHNAEVQRTLGDRVLTYDVAEGWAPLCKLLGVAVPDSPFPLTNTTEQFRERAGLEKP